MKLKGVFTHSSQSLAESSQNPADVRPAGILHRILRMRTCYLFLFILGCFSSMAQSKPDILPEFKFLKMDGTSFAKSQIKEQEKSIIIYFDPSCDHCQSEISAIGKRYDEFKNVSFYLVSANGKVEVSTFMKSYGKQLNGKKNVTVLLDPKMEFTMKFSPTQYPAIYVYSQGKLIKYFSGTTNVNDILAVK